MLLAIGFSLLALTINGKEINIKSPDSKLVVTVDDEQGLLTYRVSYMGQTMLKPSALGLKTDVGDFSRGLTFKEMKESKIDKTYTMTHTKASSAHYVARQADLTYTNSQGLPLIITFCVSNNDIAYRYTLQPKGESRLSAVVYNETSSFNFPEGTTTFLTPQSLPMVGWQRTKPSYEEDYKADVPMTERSAFGEGFTFPCLFKVPNGWVLVSETGVGSNYCASHLSDYEAVNGYTIAFPNIGEMNGLGSPCAGIPLPGSTPWRTITLGTTLAPIVETTVTNDVVRPKYKASKDYTYGKGSWSWIIGMDPSCNFDEQKRYIDFSAAMGWRSVLVDALWDVQIGYEKMEELARYGRERGVGLFLWYNSNGSWNDAPQSPKGKMDKSAARRKEMAWMQKNGILGIKVDFFGGDKQPMMQLYEDILTDANDFGLQVIFHGCTLPRGWERMYPNYVASEAVLASENLHFGQGSCDAEAQNACIHPFIRNTVGSMDFGGSTLNKHYNKDNQHGTTRKTSDVFALATAVLFQSSVQHFAMAPNNLEDAPAWAVDFMKQVPTNWDETRFIDGYPGKYCIMARRAGNKWYVAGVTSDGTPLEKKIGKKLNQFFPKGAKQLGRVDTDAIVIVGEK